jgi:hypothetical protein
LASVVASVILLSVRTCGSPTLDRLEAFACTPLGWVPWTGGVHGMVPRTGKRGRLANMPWTLPLRTERRTRDEPVPWRMTNPCPGGVGDGRRQPTPPQWLPATGEDMAWHGLAMVACLRRRVGVLCMCMLCMLCMCTRCACCACARMSVTVPHQHARGRAEIAKARMHRSGLACIRIGAAFESG